MRFLGKQLLNCFDRGFHVNIIDRMNTVTVKDAILYGQFQKPNFAFEDRRHATKGG